MDSSYKPSNISWVPVEVNQLSHTDYCEWTLALENSDGVCVTTETDSQYAKRMLSIGVAAWAIKEGLRFARKCIREENQTEPTGELWFPTCSPKSVN
ncbi:TPA: hypothetical protein ACGSTL_001342 [Vibrio parahaemolyticus]|uniref:hypothetical protein n=1 Tax=Vibrio campbellii TaxID=680 RepID=UPI001F07B9CE|nr:hypothetical protein [Vibrio campbellii]UMM06787.1 hypothetical protein MKR81_26365 [Vibrio campbellii]